MLKSLYTLSKRYREKKLVIYGVKHTSITLFSDLAVNHQMDITAFWDADDKFTGQMLINRPIINTSQLQKMKNVIVILSKLVEKQNIQQYIQEDVDLFYKDELLDINEDLENKKIFIYGIGNKGEILFDTLQEKGIEVAGICVSAPGRIERWCGKKILSVTQIMPEDDCAIILATDIESSLKDMLNHLQKLKIEKYIFYAMHIGACSQSNFFQVINIALLKQKEIWLYSSEDEYAQYMEKVLERYNINTQCKICERNIYDLDYENSENISVLILEKSKIKTEQICDILDSMGWSLSGFNYAATSICTWKVKNHIVEKRDILIGNSIYEKELYPGYVVYGDEDNANVKIMILGGSTSADGVFRYTSWVSFFYKELLAAGFSPVIYNGAVCAHGIVDEFLHMIRDIEPLKPDYVINFSGVNNTADRLTANQFNKRMGEYELSAKRDVISGIKSNESLYDFWHRVSKLFNLVAEYHGAKAYNFLQPMISADETNDLIKTSIHYSEDHTDNIGYYKARAFKEKDGGYINLVSMLEGKDRMYIDQAHYSTEANKLIAERIFDIMRHDIEKTVNDNIQQGKVIS